MAEAQIPVWRNGSEPRGVSHKLASVINPFEAHAEITILAVTATRWLYRLAVPARRAVPSLTISSALTSFAT